MEENDKDQGPPRAKTTVEMPAVPDWAIKLTESVKTGFKNVEERLDIMETNLDLQKATVVDLTKRMTRQEGRQDAIEERASSNSLRVKENSQQDLGQDAAIAALHSKVDTLEQKTDEQTATLERIAKLAANPIVKQIATAIGTAILTYLASKGLR